MMRTLILLSFLLSRYYSMGQVKDSSLRHSVSKVRLTSYLGKTVGHLLNNDTIKQVKGYHWTEKSPGILYALVLDYSKSLSLVVYVKSLKYTAPRSGTKEFDLESFKKEKITDVKFIVTCLVD